MNHIQGVLYTGGGYGRLGTLDQATRVFTGFFVLVPVLALLANDLVPGFQLLR